MDVGRYAVTAKSEERAKGGDVSQMRSAKSQACLARGIPEFASSGISLVPGYFPLPPRPVSILEPPTERLCMQKSYHAKCI